MNSAIKTTRRFLQPHWLVTVNRIQRCSTETTETRQDPRGKFAKAFDKFQTQIEEEQQGEPQQQTFAHLLRHSKFIDLGDPVGKVVQGTIFKVVDNDVYVDVGLKMHCVCARPKQQASGYVRGARVRVLLKDLELSSKFLGYDKDITLLEADGVLLGPTSDRTT